MLTNELLCSIFQTYYIVNISSYLQPIEARDEDAAVERSTRFPQRVQIYAAIALSEKF